MEKKIGPFNINTVVEGDCLNLIPNLPDESIDILVTSPPYWGQRVSNGMGTEDDPREYINFLQKVFTSFLPKLKKQGIVWLNMGDAYNTPVNWRLDDRKYSSLGPDKNGLGADTAHTSSQERREKLLSTKRLAGSPTAISLLCQPAWSFLFATMDTSTEARLSGGKGTQCRKAVAAAHTASTNRFTY